MNYGIVELKEKTIVGFAARTSNEDPQMGAIIGDLWKQLYTPENTEKIQSRVNAYAIGLYSDYDKEEYQVAGFEVSDAQSGNGAVDQPVDGAGGSHRGGGVGAQGANHGGVHILHRRLHQLFQHSGPGQGEDGGHHFPGKQVFSVLIHGIPRMDKR